MSPVLSKKRVQELREVLRKTGAYPDLLRAVDAALKPKRSAAPARKRRESGAQTRREET